MLHGRVLRPENARAKLIELKEDGARAVAGLVAIVRDGSFAGVVSETEHGAEAALNALRKGATWSDGEPLPDENDLASFLKAQPTESTTIDKKTAASPGTAARTIRRQYTRPYIAHASIAPSCAMAQWHGDRVHVWTHSQGVYLLRADLALVLKLPVENITVEHMEGAGCYGHNAADDVALDAVLLAKAAGGRPVRVQWSRQGEMSDAPFGAAMAIEIEADLDAQGEIVDWRHSIWGNGHVARPGRAAQPALLAGFELADPFPRMVSTNPPQANGGGGDRNSVPLYDFPSWRIESHRLTTMPIRTSALRTLGGQGNVFAIESILDEIAAERGEDPVAFRLRHLRDERAKDVIRAVAARAKWKPEKQPGIGHGVGFARYKNTGAYCAAIAEIEGAEEISVRKLTLAVDVGEAINPDGVINQIEGGAIQATSWVLKERVRFDRQRITSTSWTEYPILRFSEVPDVEVEVIQRPDIDPVGAGEAAHGPVTAAIANAVFDALGVRVRDLPITRDRIIAAMELSSMSSLNILSGGAAQGLVGSLDAGVQGPNRLRYCRRVWRGRRHGRQIAQGYAGRHRHPDRGASSPNWRRRSWWLPLRSPMSAWSKPPSPSAPAIPRPPSGMPLICARPCWRRTRSSCRIPKPRRPEFTLQMSFSSSASPMKLPPASGFSRMARPRCANWRRPMRGVRSGARNRPRSSAPKA